MKNESSKIQLIRCPECGSANVLNTVSMELECNINRTNCNMNYYKCNDCENIFMFE